MKFGFFRYARHICLLNLLWLAEAHGQSSQIVKEFHKDQGKRNRDEVYASINRMVQNPLLASGLVSGTESLNRSVESLMESLFYSIMDQDLRVSATDNMDITSEYKRDVHTANIGGYVVVDRFQLGPGFLKNLGEIRGLPLTFSAQGRLFITNASHRSDAQRKSETQKNGFWPNLVANWLGLLPLMSYLLPPSFNPEELYDPVSYLSTPFLFPTNIEEALKLPLGNVRSYGLSGNASFTLDTAGRAAKSLQSSLGLNDLDLTIPLSLFRDGEHRITILRRDESHVWLSLSETRRIGGSIAMPLGKHYRILQKLVSWWAGVSAPISPISFDLEKSRVYRIDELYDFNLLLAQAQDAFVKALHGDFQYVRALTAQEPKPEKLANGIEFQFRRITTRDESGHKQERSLYVAQKQKQNRFGVGESVTRDPDGEFLTLEAEHTAYDRAWNVLVGSDTVEFHHRLSIPVRKEIGPDKRSLLTLVASTENPIYLTASLRIIDSFVDTRDYHRTLGILRRYTGLSLKEAPEIPTYAEDLRQNLIREQALANPMNDIYRQQITATHLGKLASNAHIYFSHDIMLALARLGPSVLWTSLAKAFELDSEEWKEKGPREGFSYYTNIAGTYAAYPLRLLGLEDNYPDIALEAQRLRRGFDSLLAAKDPLAIQAAYEKLLDSPHPLELIQTFADMAKGLAVPILVGFDAQTQGRGRDSEDVRKSKEQFAQLNDKIFDSPWPIPPLKRDQSIEEKLASFSPGGFQNAKKTPQLAQIKILLNRSKGSPEARLQCLLTGLNMSMRHGNIQAYIRIEQHGSLNLGRFVLSEEMLKLSPDLSSISENALETSSDIYRIDMNGPEGLSNSAFLDKAIAEGGSFDMHVSLSEEGDSWGPEQIMSFSIENGILKNL